MDEAEILPGILIDTEKIRSNTRIITAFCRKNGISVTGVTKAVCGMPHIARALLEGGVSGLGESRIENIRRMRNSGIIAPMMMLRVPPLSRVEEIVGYTDISLNSEPRVIQALSDAAAKKGKIHKIILMVDLGDLREGIWPTELMDVVRETISLPGIRISGIGTNLTCFGGILPDKQNMKELAGYADRIEKSFPLKLDYVSGGNSSALLLIRDGGMPERINHLRLGESLLLGRETAERTIWPGCSTDAFCLSAEVIEVKDKPSLPIGKSGSDAFGKQRSFIDKGPMVRAILNVGREDVQVEDLTPADTKTSILGASSDHLLLDVTHRQKRPVPGDALQFSLNYGALLSAMTSSYVKKSFLPDKERSIVKKGITMIGGSPLFKNADLHAHIDLLGYKYSIRKDKITPEAIEGIIQSGKIPLVGGEENKGFETFIGLKKYFHQIGFLYLSPRPSLLNGKKLKKEETLLADVMGNELSPENTVILGLREARREEAEVIRASGISVYTMEDIDLMGMREIMTNALHTLINGTDGFCCRICTDVINAEGEGLTYREVQLAMEMAAATEKLLALDISGTPNRSWIDSHALRQMVEAAFGKRILRI